MYASVTYIDDPFRALKRTHGLIAPVPIGDLVPSSNMPVICFRNGKTLLREFWCEEVAQNDSIAFFVLPQGGGGGGKNPLKTIALVAVALVAPGIGTALAASSAGVAVASWTGITWGQVAGALVGIAGSLLVNALFPTPKPPTANYKQSGGGGQESSPTYSLQAQGNIARLGQSIPSIYGSMRVYPDYASEPYWEYSDDQQYLYVVLSLGHGYFDVDDIRIEDTSVNSFAEITWQKHDPGDDITEFHPHVITADEVTGQELFGTNKPESGYVGPFIVNPSGTTVNKLGVDVILGAGLYEVDETTGDYLDATVSFIAQYREINDDGNPVGSWESLTSQTITDTTFDAIRRSYSATVTAGRYEVRMRRTNAEGTDNYTNDSLIWAGLRGYAVEDIAFDGITTIALIMRATNNLSTQTSRRVNVLANRRLNTFSGLLTESGDTLQSEAAEDLYIEDVHTRSIAWTLADMLLKDYGGNLTESQIDLAGLRTLNDTWNGRNEYFDATFDTSAPLWSALESVARAGRAVPVFQGGIVRFVRDAEQAAIAALFTPDNIAAGSLSIEYLMPSDETADGVEVTYLDRTIWSQKTVTATATGAEATRIAKVELFGVTDVTHAEREAQYMAKANLYRRKLITLETENDGFIPTFGDMVRISHDMPAWGQHGRVSAWNAQTTTITTVDPMVWTAGATHYLGVRRTDGTLAGPYTVTRGATDSDIVLTQAPDAPMASDVLLTFGPSDNWSDNARIVGVVPREAEKVQLVCVSDPEDAEGNSLVLYGGNKGLIGANTLNDYTGASSAELASYAWIGDASGLMSDGEQGWTVGAET